MKNILLLSDTHSYIDDRILKYASEADEVWHAGDVGDYKVIEQLQAKSLFRGVYGNIDGTEIRAELPENLFFEVEGVKVFITHIGGYPPRYNARVKELLYAHRPDVYICGHSHILKVMPDKNRNLIHMNPGACGKHGFHNVRTMLRFTATNGKLGGLEVIELGKRG